MVSFHCLFNFAASMGGVASRLQGGEGARRLEESGEEVCLYIELYTCTTVVFNIQLEPNHLFSWVTPWAEEPKEEEKLKMTSR